MPSPLRISDLYIYPLKSGAGHRVDTAPLDALGFAGDRRWMVVDPNGRFLSQREIPEMALLRPELSETGLTITYPGSDAVHVRTPDAAARCTVTVWNDTCEARRADPAANAWVTRVLGVECELAYGAADLQRLVDRTYASGDERVSFADAFPLLVIGQASLDDLNLRLAHQGSAAVPMNRFRPNIVVEGAEAFAEDSWQRLRIGDETAPVEIEIVKPCARCAIVPVDQATGVRGKEPLALLSTYRRRDAKVHFGQNALLRTLGTIHVGDSVRLARD